MSDIITQAGWRVAAAEQCHGWRMNGLRCFVFTVRLMFDPQQTDPLIKLCLLTLVMMVMEETNN